MSSVGGASDRYERLRVLGEGGAGRVALVEDRLRGGSLIALKELAEASRGHEQDLRREFALLAALRHPNLVEVHDLDLDPITGLPRFTLEYVEGEGLVAAVRREGPGILLDLAAEALRALAFLHDFGLIHRDLKPGNLLVRAKPRLGCRLVVLDFGLALRGGVEGGSGAGPAGTLPYLAPELFDGQPADRRTDLYALGAVLFEAVHGAPPFTFKPGDLAGFVDAVREGRRPRPKPPAGFPPGLQSWIDGLLAPDPAERPAEAAEALARLNATCGVSYTYATPVSRAARLGSGSPAGRQKELDALWEHLEKSDGPRLVWLCGGAGSGKTRILRWLASDGVARGWEVVSPPQGLPSEAGEEEGIGAVLGRLRERAANGRVLVLVDEVETASGRTAEFLERAAREGRAAPLRVVAAVRPAELRHPGLKRLLSDTGIVPTLRREDLEPLDASSVREFAERATGSEAISDARVKWLVEASEGNPLAVESLLVEGDWERGGRTRKVLALDRSSAGRLELLSAPGRAWLEALSVLGEGVDAVMVGRLAGLDPEVSLEAAAEVAAAGLARAKDGRWSADSRSVAEQVASGIEADRRREMRRRGAELLLEIDGDAADPWRLARLWSGAGERERTVEAAERAAEKARAEGDSAEAADRYAYAVRHLVRRDPRRCGLRLQQADALMNADLSKAAAKVYRGALALASRRSDKADITARLAYALSVCGEFSRARAAAERSLELARGEGAQLTEARAQRVLGIVLVRTGRDREALPYFQQALATVRSAQDSEAEAEALHGLATCEASLQVPDADTHFREAVALYQQLGRDENSVKSLIGLARLRHLEGDRVGARSMLEQSKGIVLKCGRPGLLVWILSRIAAIEMDDGRLDRSIQALREADDHARHLGNVQEHVVATNGMAEALLQSGRHAEAESLLRPILRHPPGLVDSETLDYTRLILAAVILESAKANSPEAQELIETALGNCRLRGRPRSRMVSLTFELERLALLGPTEPLEPIAAELDTVLQELATGLEPEYLARVGLAKSVWALSRGDSGSAARNATEALTVTQDADLPALGARISALLSDALLRLGRPDEAAHALSQGRRLLEDAALRIDDVSVRRDFLARSVFRGLRAADSDSREAADRRLLALYDMVRALNSETDPEALLESALEMALGVVQGERGMILLRDSGSDAFSIRLARNLEQETADDAEAFSRSVVAQAGEGKPVLALDAGHDERFQGFKSISLYRIRSLMCVPLRSRGKLIGTVYVDSRREGRLFTKEDLRFLEAFADHAALALENARARAELERENRRLQELAGVRARFDNIVGRAAPMQKVFDLIEKIAASELAVLIQGESGTGKELVARAIHFHGPRKRRIFLSENCAAIPETLLESELFGHVRGAFTGADRDRTGLFEQANGGTLFLDEIGDMSAGMQARLLRVLEEGEVRRVGASRPIHVDVRVLAATHRDLSTEVAAGRFREDLMYRLQVLVVQLPPLRERPGDVALLAEHFLERIGRERGRKPARLGGEVLEILERYAWPGNVRQLENVLQRLSLLAGDRTLTKDVLESDSGLRSTLLPGKDTAPLYSLEQTEREEIRKALEAARGSRDRAAKSLGISRATIYRKIKEYRLH